MWYNPLVGWLLRSPLHGLIDRNLTLITCTGRKSGRQYTTPVNYLREGNTLWILSKRERSWWRNLRGGAPVTLLLGGVQAPAFGEAMESEQELLPALGDYFARAPQLARYYKLRVAEDGISYPEDLARLAESLVLVRAELQA